MLRVCVALAMLLPSGCASRQSLPELLTPDSVQIGASVKADQPQRIDAYTIQLRWDLK